MKQDAVIVVDGRELIVSAESATFLNIYFTTLARLNELRLSLRPDNLTMSRFITCNEVGELYSDGN